MANAKVKLDSAGVKALLQDPGVRAELRRLAAPVLAQAIATAPVATGAYRDGLGIWDDTTDRAAVRVGSTDRKGPIVEARTGHLARALDAAGG